MIENISRVSEFHCDDQKKQQLRVLIQIQSPFYCFPLFVVCAPTLTHHHSFAEGSPDRTLIVKGPSSATVRLLYEKIQAILVAKRGGGERGEFTHFLSIPLSHALGERYERWRTKALSLLPPESHSSLVPAPSLHLTLCMLTLPTPDAVAKAQQVLQDAAADVYDAVDSRSLVCTFEGLDVFDRDSLTDANVVFMRVAFESDSLVRMRNMIARLRDDLHAAGLLEQAQGEDVKFHVTVLNRKRDVEARFVGAKLDVTRLIGDNRGDAVWHVEAARGAFGAAAFKDPKSGAYVSEGKIALP
jgi:2'-5' RNA ligase